MNTVLSESEQAARIWASHGKQDATATHSVQLTRASDVQMRPIDWLWQGFLPRGMLTLLAGLPGCGKSTLALAVAATITNAGRWPDGTPACTPGSVLIWSSEDAADTVLTPCLMACGADLSRVHFVDKCRNADGTLRAFDPSTDMQLLQQQVENMPDLSLMILDPVLSAVGGDSHKAAETRRGLQAVVDIAAARNVAILGITHFRKGGSGTDPAERVIGSQAFVALARMVLIASKVDDPDNPKALKRIVARAKSNISADDGGFEFHLKQSEVKRGIWAQGIRWGAAITGSALSLLNAAETGADDENDEGDAVTNACEFLNDVQADGQKPSTEVESSAKASGFTIATLRRAKKRIGVRSVKSAMSGCWVLELPKVLINPEDAHTKEVSAFAKNEHLRTENDETELEL